MDNSQPPVNLQTGIPEVNYENNIAYSENQALLADALRENIGNYVIAEFLIGTVNMECKEGILFFVGTDYLTLYLEEDDCYTMCDLASLRFITFFQTRTKPRNFRNARYK